MAAGAGAAAGAATGGMVAGLPGTVVGALVGGLAGSLPFLLMGNGMPSEAEQERMLRRQLEIQDEFDQRRAGRAGGDLGGLMDETGGGGMGLAGLMRQDELTDQYAMLADDLDRSMRTRSVYDKELERILAGSTARLAQLQSPRTLSPVEIIQMVEGIGG